MSDTLGVTAEQLGRGSWFLGPQGKAAWSPVGYLSSALGAVVRWDVAAHPTDPWPPQRGWPPAEFRAKAATARRRSRA